MSSKPKVNIVVPMAGRGSRFANQGFLQPKPIIDVAGRPMIHWVLDNVDAPDVIEATFILIILKEQEDRYGLSQQLQKLKPRMKFVFVSQVTEGAACTALLAREYMDNGTPLFIVNSDQYVEWDARQFWKNRMTSTADGDILCFYIPMEENDVKWSYAALDENGEYVTTVKEKQVISPNATVGFYYWRRGADFCQSADTMILADFRVNGEFYVAPAYNIGIDQFGRKYTVSFCKKMWGLGVPADLVKFLNEYARPRMQPAFDTKYSFYGRSAGPIRFIAHRGNLKGPDKVNENRPEHLRRALELGFDIEIDIWKDEKTGALFLGHDEPQYPIDYRFLLQQGVWVHCKNGAALRALTRDPRIHCFSHDKDDYTLTSRGIIWAYPDQPLLGEKCVAVMYSNQSDLLKHAISGICHDNVGVLRDMYIAGRTLSSKRNIKLIIFDLDGVLVESRDLHYQALNQALEEVAGKEFVVNREEHEFIYDGLSTNQKLLMLQTSKNLDPNLHVAVWKRKQELTDEFVKKLLSPTKQIVDTLKFLKSCGFPVAVASNCIRSSVGAILKQIGVLDMIDAYFSNEDVVRSKPEPDMYLKTCIAFCVKPSEALVVEDSAKGFEAAARAGCNLLRVSCPGDLTSDLVMQRVQELETPSETVTVLVPLAGPAPEIWMDSTSLCNAPFEIPAFLTDAAGRPSLNWVMQSVRSHCYSLKYVFLVKESQCAAFKLESICAAAIDYQPFEIIKIKVDTLGSLNTLLDAERLENVCMDSPLLVADGHHVPEWESVTSLDNMMSTHAEGAVAVCASRDPRWSYVRLMPGQTDFARVAEVHMERHPVSNLACTGLYFYREARYFFEAAHAIISRNERARGRFYTAQTFNEMISRGMKVTTVNALNVWSLRTYDEIQEFSRHYVPWAAHMSFTDTYSEMSSRQLRSVNENGLKCDADLLKAEDPRRCLAVYALCSTKNFISTKALSMLQSKVRSILGEKHCYYLPLDKMPTENGTEPQCFGTLHWTFMQLVSFQVFGKVKIPEEYTDLVEVALNRYLPHLKIHFTRLILTPSNLLMVGYPSVDVNTARDQLRRTLQRCGFPFFEPYRNDIVHATLVRFASPIDRQKVETLQAELENFQNDSLGMMAVEQLTLSPATWRMQVSELDNEQQHPIPLM